jgi:hypothetical protein
MKSIKNSEILRDLLVAEIGCSGFVAYPTLAINKKDYTWIFINRFDELDFEHYLYYPSIRYFLRQDCKNIHIVESRKQYIDLFIIKLEDELNRFS